MSFLLIMMRTVAKPIGFQSYLLLIVRAIIYFCPKASFSPHYTLIMTLWPEPVLVSIIIKTCLVIKLSSQIKAQKL